jgi:hypothetical protein
VSTLSSLRPSREHVVVAASIARRPASTSGSLVMCATQLDGRIILAPVIAE